MPADQDLLEQVAAEVVPGAVIEHIGTGGFASTFRVTTTHGETFALKVIDANLSDDDRVDRELAALQRVHHPNVVAYQGAGVEPFNDVDYRWLRMDYIEGESLRNVLASGRTFDLAEGIDLLTQAVAGASAMWAEKTAHRDLSPGNLLLTADGRIVIVDLGLARHLEDETITNLPTPGTPGWMSPEQVSSTPTHGDWRSDQFVLGLIGYRLITGAEPFNARSLIDRWLAPSLVTPRPARDIDPAIPSQLSELLVKMLSHAPHRRFLQPAALSTELKRVAASLAITGPSSATTPRFYLTMGDKKTYAEGGFLPQLAADGIIVEPRSANRVADFVEKFTPTTTTRAIDPATHLARSPLVARKAFYDKLPFAASSPLVQCPEATARRAFCTEVLNFQLAAHPDQILAPYYYAGSGEMAWIEESLRSAEVTRDLLEQRAPDRGGVAEPVWSTVAVAASWLSQLSAREELLTVLTAQGHTTVHLLVHTTQASFAPLADASVLEGLADVIAVMRDAGIELILGRRSSEGLLGLALGAGGWSTGPAGVAQNMTPHPEVKESGGPGYERVYVPQLLTNITTGTYTLFAEEERGAMELTTPQGFQLLDENPDLEDLTSEQRILLLQHNMLAMRAQASDLAALADAGRVPAMQEWVNAAREVFAELPDSTHAAETDSFLRAWQTVLT